MKKIKIGILILSLILAMLPGSAQTLCDIITFDGQEKGQPAAKPIDTTERGGTARVDQVAGNKVLKIAGGAEDTDNAFVQIPFSQQPNQKVTVSFRVLKSDKTTEVTAPTLRSNEGVFFNPLTFTKEGQIKVNNGQIPVMEYQENTWYDISVSVDMQNNLMSYRISDGTTQEEAGNIAAAKSLGNLQAVRFHITGKSAAYLYLDDWGISEEESFCLTESSIAQGQENVALNPKFQMTFNREVDGCSLDNIAVNGDKAYIKSAVAEGAVVKVRLAKALGYATKYTLNLGGLKDLEGNQIGRDLTFTTKYGYNITEDDFETGSYDTSKWRPMVASGGTVMEVINAPKPEDQNNYALHLNAKTATEGSYQVMLQTPMGMKQLPGDTVIEYSFMRADTEENMDILEIRDSTNNQEPSATNAGLMRLGKDGKVYFYDKTEGYVEVAGYQAGEWVSVAIQIYPTEGTYRLTVKGEPKKVNGKDFTFKTAFVHDGLQMVRFQIQNKKQELYLDDLKVAQRLAFQNGSFFKTVGEETVVLEKTDATENTFMIPVVNNASAAENAALVLAAYDKLSGCLEKTSITDAVIAPEGRTTVSASLRWLPSDAYEVKAFFLKSLSSLESYRTVLGAKIYELPAGTSGGAEVQTIAASLNRGESVVQVYPGGKYKALTMRYDDGTANDRRLLEIFNRYGIRGTFYLIPTYLNRGGDSITDAEVPALYAGHEVGNHTYSHQRPSDLSVPALEQEVESGKIYLERITGETVRGFAYPYSEFGTDKEAFIQSLKNTGHTYAVTGTSSRTFELPDLSKPYEIPFTIRHRENLMDMAQQYLALAQKKRSLFFVMGHAHEFENENNWELMEEFSSVMSGKQDIWYATNGEVFGYLMAQERTAVPQTGSSLTTNHTAQTLWYQVGERLVKVRPGDTLKITGAEEAR